MLDTLNNIQLEMKIIQLQLYLAKRSTKMHNSPIALVKVESHINHSLHSLNHLIAHIDDFKTDAEIKDTASNRIKENT